MNKNKINSAQNQVIKTCLLASPDSPKQNALKYSIFSFTPAILSKHVLLINYCVYNIEIIQDKL